MTALEKQILETFPKDQQKKIDWVELIGNTIEIYYKSGAIADFKISLPIVINERLKQ